MRTGIFLAVFLGSLALRAQAPIKAAGSTGHLRVPVVVRADAQPSTMTFWVDASDSVAFAMRSARPDHRLIYTDPEGRVWDTAAPSPDALETWSPPDPAMLPEGPGTLYHLVVDKPAAGRWMLALQTPSPAPEPVSALLVVFFQNRVAATMTAATATLVSGKPLTVTLALNDGAGRRRNLHITSTLTKEGDPEPLPLNARFLDDGTHGDPAAGDGFYTAVLPTADAGRFHLEARVEGSASTGHCQRSCGLGFKVVAQAARLTGNFVQRQQAGPPE